MANGYLTMHLEEEENIVGIVFVPPACSLVEVRAQISKQEVPGLRADFAFLWTAAKAQLSSAQEAFIRIVEDQEKIYVRLLPQSAVGDKRNADLELQEPGAKAARQADSIAGGLEVPTLSQ
jgi:hypothetical protein